MPGRGRGAASEGAAGGLPFRTLFGRPGGPQDAVPGQAEGGRQRQAHAPLGKGPQDQHQGQRNRKDPAFPKQTLHRTGPPPHSVTTRKTTASCFIAFIINQNWVSVKRKYNFYSLFYKFVLYRDTFWLYNKNKK